MSFDTNGMSKRLEKFIIERIDMSERANFAATSESDFNWNKFYF